jgi:hypothetical protein
MAGSTKLDPDPVSFIEISRGFQELAEPPVEADAVPADVLAAELELEVVEFELLPPPHAARSAAMAGIDTPSMAARRIT